MHASVRNTFSSWVEGFEGYVPHMYLDIKFLVTVGRGNLIDPMSLATGLPFQRKGAPGSRATPAEIQAEWIRVKAAKTLASKGARHFASMTKLELGKQAIDDLVKRRLDAIAADLKKRSHYLAFDAWPADAQLGALGMAWGLGSGGLASKFPTFSKACAGEDFDTAAEECRISDPGIERRNAAHKLLFENAAAVVAGGRIQAYRRETLYYPQVCLKPVEIRE